MIGVIMSFKPNLAVVPYTGGDESHKGRPFAHEATILVSSWRCKIYTNDIYIADGKPTTIKVFVGHDSPAAIFNSLELGQLADEKEGSVRVCHIQASTVVVAGYFNGFTKTLNVDHWTKHYNVLPCLRNIDVKVQIWVIEDPTGEPYKFGSQNKVFVAHILCAEKNEAKVNLQFGNTYCKERKA